MVTPDGAITTKAFLGAPRAYRLGRNESESTCGGFDIERG